MHSLKLADSKPCKDSIESVLARNPEILAMVERERLQRQHAWEADLIGDLIHSERLPEDVAKVAAKHSRTFKTGTRKAWNIMQILQELNQQ